MKVSLAGLGLGLLTLVLLVASAFVSVGGMQVVTMLRGPDLPSSRSSTSPAEDLLYLREAVLRNERGATPEQYRRFTVVIDTAELPATSDDLTLVASQALAQFANAHTTHLERNPFRLKRSRHGRRSARIVVA